MSRSTRLTALAQAIGADIKDLKARSTQYALGGLSTMNAAAGWNQIPFAAGTAFSTTDGIADFTRNASGSLTFNKAGTYTIAATLGNTNAAQPTSGTMDLRLTLGPVGTVTPDNNATQVAVERRQAVAGEYNIASLAATVTVAAGQSLAAWIFVAVAVTGVGVSSISVVRNGGPPGPKGDPGNVSVVTTLDWNTATSPNFYRSSNDPLNTTNNGPGDQLSHPSQQGLVTVHQDGSISQRVWDSSAQRAYTRYRTGGVWSAWILELAKPPVYIETSIGGVTPEDGEERYFQNAAMKALGVMWRFRYDKTPPAGKPPWVFVGGSDWVNELTATFGPYVAGQEQTASLTAASLTTALSLTVPLQGTYQTWSEAIMVNNNGGGGAGGIHILRGADGSPGWQSADSLATIVTGGVLPMQARKNVTTAGADEVLWSKYTTTNAGLPMAFYARRMGIRPVRVFL